MSFHEHTHFITFDSSKVDCLPTVSKVVGNHVGMSVISFNRSCLNLLGCFGTSSSSEMLLPFVTLQNTSSFLTY